MIAKGFRPSVVTKDGCLPIHFFVEFGLEKGPYTLAEDGDFLEMVFIDLIKDVSLDFSLPNVCNIFTFFNFFFLQSIRTQYLELVATHCYTRQYARRLLNLSNLF